MSTLESDSMRPKQDPSQLGARFQARSTLQPHTQRREMDPSQPGSSHRSTRMRPVPPQHRPPRVRLRRIIILAWWLLLAGLFGQPSLPAQSNVDRARKLEEQRKKLKLTLEEEGSVLDMLDQIDRSILEQEAQLEDLRTRQVAVEQRIGGLEQERMDLESGLAERRIQLQQRLRALYKYSSRGFMQALFSGGSGTDILKRTKYLQQIIKRDMGLIGTQREALARFGEVKQALENERVQVKALARDVESQMVAAQAERLRKKDLLKRIRQERSVASRTVRELEAAAIALTRQLESLPLSRSSTKIDLPTSSQPKSVTEPPAAKPSIPAARPSKSSRRTTADTRGGHFSKQRGLLPFPVKGGKVTKAFGRYKTPGMKAYDFNRGLDVTAPAGVPFKAIYTGEIKLAKWFKGYGLLVIVDHGNGYHSIYAHASKLLKKKGDRVITGETIGLVGDTGSFQGPYLYLEVRRKGKPVNPLEWIRVPPDAMAIDR